MFIVVENSMCRNQNFDLEKSLARYPQRITRLLQLQPIKVLDDHVSESALEHACETALVQAGIVRVRPGVRIGGLLWRSPSWSAVCAI